MIISFHKISKHYDLLNKRYGFLYLLSIILNYELCLRIVYKFDT